MDEILQVYVDIIASNLVIHYMYSKTSPLIKVEWDYAL